MPQAARTDANQQEIVDALRKVGASVESLHRVGGGVPDLLIGFRNQNFLIEVKTGTGRLNDRQRDWHQLWRGHVAIARTIDEALRAVGLLE